MRYATGLTSSNVTLIIGIICFLIEKINVNRLVNQNKQKISLYYAVTGAQQGWNYQRIRFNLGQRDFAYENDNLVIVKVVI